MQTKSVGRKLRLMKLVVVAALAAPLPHTAQAQDWSNSRAQSWQAQNQRSPLAGEIKDKAGKDLRPFYAARQFRPLWLNEFGRPSGAASMLMHRLRTAQYDGLKPSELKFDRLAELVDEARRGDRDDIARAEVELSRAFAAYVRGMRGVDRETMIYESDALAPVVPTARAALEAATMATSLEDYVDQMRWMHPLYAPLREAMDDPSFSAEQRAVMATNLARIRAIPAMPMGRHILVDAAGARLYMYEDGQVVDSMKVVVGKPELPTPMMAGFVRHAIVNPYWNVPTDLAATNIADNVLKKGVGYLKSGGYQVLANWTDNASLVDPKTIDWRAVRVGREEIRVRQLPGGSNFMGKVKFEFPNPIGIYMHDTPDKQLMKLADRHQSSGCVRLEDAARMHRWLMGEPLPAKVTTAEQTVPLPEMVPIYITYLTALPSADTQQIAFQHDAYGRDLAPLNATGRMLASVDQP